MPQHPAVGLPADDILANMVKDSGYVVGSNFAADATNRQRYLVVLALPYEESEVSSIRGALEAVIDLLRDGEEEGTMFQVWDSFTGELHQDITIEDLKVQEDFEADEDEEDEEDEEDANAFA